MPIQARGRGKAVDLNHRIKEQGKFCTAKNFARPGEKIGKSTYQFKRKGNEHQFHFNSTIEETICLAKEELARVKPAIAEEKAALKRAETKLEEGTKALAE